MKYIIAFALGAFFNAYRGGLFTNRGEIVGRIRPDWLRKIVNFLVQGDTVNALAFASFIITTHASVYHGISNGLPVFLFLPVALALFLYQVAMMFRGATPGWGEYIGAAGGWRPTVEEPLKSEVHYIDRLIESLRSRPRLWGIAGLSLRCGEWGLFIGAPLVGFIGLQAFLPILAGLLAGPLVYVLSKVLPQKYVWKGFESIHGGLLWISCV